MRFGFLTLERSGCILSREAIMNVSGLLREVGIGRGGTIRVGDLPTRTLCRAPAPGPGNG